MQILLWKPQTWPKTRSCSKRPPQCWPKPTPPSRTFSACCKAKRNATLRCKTIKKDRSAARGPVWFSGVYSNPCTAILTAFLTIRQALSEFNKLNNGLNKNLRFSSPSAFDCGVSRCCKRPCARSRRNFKLTIQWTSRLK